MQANGISGRLRRLLHIATTLRRLGECDDLIHPSLHDSGGLICMKAMAFGLPVISLDLGGSAVQVTKEPD